MNRLNHGHQLVSTPSRTPPAVLHVNREARNECLSIYKLRIFDYGYLPGIENAVYWNPSVDILLFGSRSCALGLGNVLGAVKDNPEVTRIAIMTNGSCANSAGHEFAGRSYEPPLNYLRVLRGIKADDGRVWYGHRGLKEVYFVAYQDGHIDPRTTVFRPATDQDLCTFQISKERHWTSAVRSIKYDRPLIGVGPNRWAGTNKPKFSYVNLAPLANGTNFMAPMGAIDEFLSSASPSFTSFL